MIQNRYEIDVDLKQKTAIKMPSVTQNDTVVFSFRMFDAGRIYNVQNGTTFTLTATRSDKVTVMTEGNASGENTVEFTLGGNELAVEGKVNAVVQVYDENGRISSIPFSYYVLNDPTTDYIPSEHEQTLIARVLGDGPQVIANVEQAGDRAVSKADYAEQVSNLARTNWLSPPLPTLADVQATHVNPSNGDTIMTHTDGRIYRYANGRWNHTQTYTDSALTSIQNQLSEQDQQEQVLVHGLNVLASDSNVSSPLKVEFYGDTKVNYFLGGNFAQQGEWSTSLAIDNSTYKLGTSSGKIDNSTGATQKTSINNQKNYVTGKQVLVGVWAKSASGTPSIQLVLLGYDSTDTYFENAASANIAVDSNWKFYYVKLDLTTKTSAHWKLDLRVKTYGTSNDIVNFDGAMITPLTSEQYNKIGDLSLIGKDVEYVEKNFPYVSGIQHVVNPYAKVSGVQLIPPFSEWSLNASAEVISPYEINNISGGNVSEYKLNLVKNQQYTLTNSSSSEGNNFISIYDKNSSSYIIACSAGQSKTFSVTDNSNLFVRTYGGIARKPMLNLGDKALPFEVKNDSYIYARTTLAGDPVNPLGKKDILSYNESLQNPRWEVERWFKQITLDGSYNWAFHSDLTGFKRVRPNAPVTNYSNSGVMIKHNGKPLTYGATAQEGIDYFAINSSYSGVIISVAPTPPP